MCLKDKYWLTVLPVCLFALAGCPQLRGGPNRYIKRDVKPAELVGTWQVTDNSLERLVKEGYSKYVKKELNQLILLDGGMCNICMYDPWIPTPTPEEDEECYKPLTGATWKITKQIAYVGHRETMVPAVESEGFYDRISRRSPPLRGRGGQNLHRGESRRMGDRNLRRRGPKNFDREKSILPDSGDVNRPGTGNRLSAPGKTGRGHDR